MTIFLTGATGYIGGAVGDLLLRSGHTVTALTRSADKASALRERGYDVLVADLTDVAPFDGAFDAVDAVVNCADADDPYFVATVLAALRGTGKTFVHTSGSSIVGDRAAGAYVGAVHDDGEPAQPRLEKLGRVMIDRAVLEASQDGIRSAVVCPTMIYGEGPGLHAHSIQVPMLIASARRNGVVRHIGAGENVWSTVHVEDLARLYLLVTEQTEPGVFYFAEDGEVRLADLTAAIAETMGLDAESWPVEAAAREWGTEAAHFALGSNSRVRASAARRLGWVPTGGSLLDEVRAGYSGLAAA